MEIIFRQIGHHLAQSDDICKVGIIPGHNVSVKYNFLKRTAPFSFHVKDFSVRVVLKEVVVHVALHRRGRAARVGSDAQTTLVPPNNIVLP